uniref:DUF6824 domain-containing protein n=1 Tax=Amphora coffeiformis TaxID=265554 RepID=A0A7S3L681_9STRA|mmetsp:Transcript_11563/g.22142  ORF Transcript_11563/g.22142 Transcript_11563/m.22142 type:complete len:450 (+) Transcript_11563:195-1544(+)|eukprot:scaffold39358_cov237-Amphora_coffeaeformis.AAC.1
MKESPASEEEIATALGPHDVLMGRGAPVSEYDGNKMLREIVMKRQSEYVRSSKRQEKHHVAMEIVATVKENGGRFLRKVKDEAEEEDNEEEHGKNDRRGLGKTKWRVVTNKDEIVGKVKQLLRDMGPEARKKRANRRPTRPEFRRRSSSSKSPIYTASIPATTAAETAATSETNAVVTAEGETKTPSEKVAARDMSVLVQGMRGTGLVSGIPPSQSLPYRSLPCMRSVPQPQEQPQQQSELQVQRYLPPLRQQQQEQQQRRQLALGLPAHSSQARLTAQYDAERIQMQSGLNLSPPADARSTFGAQPQALTPSLLSRLLQIQRHPHPPSNPFENSFLQPARESLQQQQTQLLQQQSQALLSEPLFRLLLHNQRQTQRQMGPLSMHDQSVLGSLQLRNQHQQLLHTQDPNALLQNHRHHLLAGRPSTRGATLGQSGLPQDSQKHQKQQRP